MSIKRRIPVAGVGSCGGDAFHDTDWVNGAALGEGGAALGEGGAVLEGTAVGITPSRPILRCWP